MIADHAERHPLEHGLPVDAARQRLGLPDIRLVHALVTPPLAIADGRINQGGPSLPAPVARAVSVLHAELAAAPYVAPTPDRLAQLGLGQRELAAAVRVGALAKLADGVYLAPDAVADATRRLAELPQPFTVSQARAALGTTRRVAVPLLELLDAQRRTERLADDRRRVTA
jgi:selenocysteine-specific elongation factor